MSSIKTINVKKEFNNLRLDIFLSSELEENRSQVQKMIKNNQITINDKLPKKAGDRVKTEDEIVIKLSSPTDKQTNKQTKTKTTNEAITDQVFRLEDIEVIAKTPEYIIVNKPTGLLTHSKSIDLMNGQSLAEILIKKYPELKKVGDEPQLRPGIVHRLDKDASGLLIIPRTPKMFTCLKQQFKNRKVVKEYLVLVHGQIESDTGKIDFPIARSKNSERFGALPVKKLSLADYYRKIKGNHNYKNSREALSEFWVEQRFINFTLLRVKIHTGRTHQIRVHMLAYNHPVVGDNIYFQKKQKRKLQDRLFLHCIKLGFADLNSEQKIFEIDLPTELKNMLKTIK